jgi:hypothetical protein
MGQWIFSPTSMVIIHLSVDDFVRSRVLVRLAQMYNPFSNKKYSSQIGKYSAIFAVISSNAL